METAFKLVVVFPFGKYRRGEVIYDQEFINSILDKSNLEMHALKKNVRLVSYKYMPKSLVVEQPQDNEIAVPQEENLEVQLSSVSGLEEETLPRNKRLNKFKGD